MKKNKEKEIIEQALERYKKAKDAWSENYENAQEDIRFARLNEQWPEKIKRERELRGRPCLTINLLPNYIKQVINDIRQSNPGINVFPVDDKADEETAKIYNGIIRVIEQDSCAETAYDEAADDAVTSGFGFFRINVDYTGFDSFDLQISIEKIANPLSVIFDSSSKSSTSEDWNYCFVINTMSKDEFEEQYPSADSCESLSGFEPADYVEDWMSEDSISVAEYWIREEEEVELLLTESGEVVTREIYEQHPELGEIVKTRMSQVPKVTQYIINSNEILDEVEWPGQYIPIIPVFGEEVNIEEKRCFFGLTHFVKDVQRNFNYWRSMSTEMVALAPKAPFIGPAGSFASNKKKWDSINRENHSYLEYDGDTPPQRQPFDAVPAGALQEAANATQDIRELLGIHQAAVGAPTKEIAGIAIREKRKESDNATFHFADNLSRAITHAGKILLDIIPQVYSESKIVRVLGPEKKEAEMVPVNQRFIKNGREKFYDLSKGRYDLVVKSGPQYATLREESSKQMLDLIKAVPTSAPYIVDLFVDNLDWPGANEIAKRMRAMLPPHLQNMDKLGDMPDEAKAMVASLMKKLQESTVGLKKLQLGIEEKDAEIRALLVQAESKEKDIQQKEFDSQRKYEAQIAKLQSETQKNKAEYLFKSQQTEREIAAEQENIKLKAKMDMLKEEHTEKLEQQGHQIEMLNQQIPEIIERSIMAILNRPKEV